MKKLLSTIYSTLLVCVCEAQTMRVWMKDGSERQFAVSEIDSVTFSAERTTMEQVTKEINQFLDDWNAAMIAAQYRDEDMSYMPPACQISASYL